MKTLTFLLALSATTAQADSLCAVTDPQRINDVLAGAWSQEGAISIETETLSVTQPLDDDTPVTIENGTALVWPMTDQWLNEALSLITAPVRLDVDGVDDLLDTADAFWIADAVGDTPCGPEDLPQVSGSFTAGEQGKDDVITGTLTLIPYFEDRVVLLAELEMRGAWGLAFVTGASLLTP